MFQIRAHRIIACFRKHSFLCSPAVQAIRTSVVLFTFPWIHGIDIANLIISCQFDMPRHHDFIKTGSIKPLFIKVARSARYIFAKCKVPLTIQ